MDDGLIFPYPLWCAHIEAGDTKDCLLRFRSSEWGVVGVWPDPVVGKRWGDAGR
jgi:hypothetical protein